jgi:hypothetical protein
LTLALRRWQWLAGLGVAVGLSATVVGSAWMQDQSGSRANDGKTLAGESASTQETFVAVWGADAPQRWVTEHNAEIARLAPAPPPAQQAPLPPPLVQQAPPPELPTVPPPPTPLTPDEGTATPTVFFITATATLGTPGTAAAAGTATAQGTAAVGTSAAILGTAGPTTGATSVATAGAPTPNQQTRTVR